MFDASKMPAFDVIVTQQQSSLMNCGLFELLHMVGLIKMAQRSAKNNTVLLSAANVKNTAWRDFRERGEFTEGQGINENSAESLRKALTTIIMELQKASVAPIEVDEMMQTSSSTSASSNPNMEIVRKARKYGALKNLKPAD